MHYKIISRKHYLRFLFFPKFVKARDDQHDYECQLRQEQREQRHRERRSASVTSAKNDVFSDEESSMVKKSHFSEHDAHVLVEDIKRKTPFLICQSKQRNFI
jgi:hypothetical protein